MVTAVTVKNVFDNNQQRLLLQWVAGQQGENKELHLAEHHDHDYIRYSLIGHLNLIQQHLIQVIGKKESTYLESLAENIREDMLDQLFSSNATCIIVTNGIKPMDRLVEHANQSATPLLTSERGSHELIEYLQYSLSHSLSERTTIHGVFMEVMGSGIMLTGESGIGKSELALELISRGHRLIADDAPEFSIVSPDTISGSCPEILKDILEVRGLGVLNIRSMYGDGAIKTTKYLRLVISLVRMNDEEMKNVDRLMENKQFINILGIDVPMLTLPVASGRNLAVMVEAAIRNHLLYLSGYDSSKDFLERQKKLLEN